ncbi:hypothetical protein NEE14_008410 [Parabacteroides sp. AD58]|uniref:Uncharacterized protein n=1 Tax=Parabacteroides absconsus TaxID=2951805 RepID=A0ABZ2INT0_9BACT|nr:hypothetical protein [Parabacteroides sp. AD58]MCM6902512.1 hypothetical protein [Parabacteroides sp. AD58]
MTRIRKSWENQALGILPLLLFLLLDNYISYLQAYTVSAIFCVLSMFVFHILRKDKIYSFMLLPSFLTLILYAFFLIFMRVEEVLAVYTPLITEILLIIVLTVVKIVKKPLLHRVRDAQHPAYEKTHNLTMLNEFFFIAQLFRNLYILHLLGIAFYNILPEEMKDIRFNRFLYRDMGLIIGVAVIVYEQIRLLMVRGRLKKEMWLPVLNDKGSVIGCIAYSVSRLLPKKYYHPIVRIALVHKGMLYLAKRNEYAYVSASMIDYPFYRYVLFRQSIEAAAQEAVEGLKTLVGKIQPRLLIRYTFENERVKHQVSLFVICIQDEQVIEQYKQVQNGKLWSIQQIEENLGKGIFSVYFEREFSYLKNTILLAENLCLCGEQQEAKPE